MRFPTIRDYADGFLRLKLNGVEWLGVRIVDQDEANDQISKLLRTEAAKRFVVYNPSGPVDFTAWFEAYQCDGSCDRDDCKGTGPGIDWLVVGGESGPGARPMHPDWVRSTRDQCRDAGVAFFFKQWGAWRPTLPDEEYDTTSGRAGRPPAFLVKRDGTVRNAAIRVVAERDAAVKDRDEAVRLLHDYATYIYGFRGAFRPLDRALDFFLFLARHGLATDHEDGTFTLKEPKT